MISLLNFRTQNPQLFADDTTVLTEGSSIHDLNVKLNLVAQDLSPWTQQNRMVTNTLKTKTTLIHSPQQLKNTSDRSLSVTLNGKILAQVKQAKVLGLTLDEFLIGLSILTTCVQQSIVDLLYYAGLTDPF